MAASSDTYALKQFSARNGHEQVHVDEREKVRKILPLFPPRP